MFEDITDELVMKFLLNVHRKILDPGINFCPFDYPREDEGWERGLLKLDDRPSANGQAAINKIAYTQCARS